jgi:hypothetical protein
MPKKTTKKVLEPVPGVIEVTIPVKLHAELLEDAKREGVTLEELTLSVLSAAVARRNGHRQGIVDGVMATLGVLEKLQAQQKKSKRKGAKA